MPARRPSLALDRTLPWLVPVAILLLWQIVVSLGWVSARTMPAPSSVAVAAWQLAVSGQLFSALAISSERAALGFAIGGSIGLFLGLVVGLWRLGETLFDSTIQMLRNIPHLAMIPLVILWFGIGETAKVFLVAIGTAFPIYLNTFHGIRNIDPDLMEMARNYGLSRGALFRHVILPGAMPSILVGVRYSLGLMWLTLIVAETIAASNGIGYLAMNARQFLETNIVVVTILLYALLGKLADEAARFLERRWLTWHPAYAKPETVA